jgi:superfamily II DNA or RNA helicase
MGRRGDPDGQRIKLLASVDGRCEIPRGCLLDLREAAKVSGVTLVWDPQIRTNAVASRTVAELEAEVRARTGKPFAFRPEYQPEIVATILAKRQGMVVLPCGGGKTVSGVAAVLASGEAALIMVHTEDLLEQWVGAIRHLSGRDPRVVGGGDHDPRPLAPGEIVVGMVQTLSPNLGRYGRLLASVGFLMVDECHRAPADLFAAVINRCQGRYRIGLSATPNRADGYGFLIQALIGPTLFRLAGGARDLITWGYLRRPLVVPVASTYSPSDDTKEWTISCPSCAEDPKRADRAVQVLSSLEDKRYFLSGTLSCKRKGRQTIRCSRVFSGKEPVELGKLVLAQVQTEAALDPARIKLISGLVQDGVEVGRLCLTLTNRKDGVSALEADQRARGLSVRGATSETEARGAVISAFRAGRYRSLIATQLADEGLDVPALDQLVMASAGRHDGTAQQRLGRICRPAGAQVPVAFDVVDAYPAALSQWRERAAAYVEAYGPECLPTDRPVPLGTALRVLDLLANGADAADCADLLGARSRTAQGSQPSPDPAPSKSRTIRRPGPVKK